MAVNVFAGQPQPIQLALTTGKNKAPISAQPLTRERIQLFDRVTNALLHTSDSNTDPNVFFTGRTEVTVKGVPNIFLLEIELHNEGVPIKEDMVARLTLYDGAHPLGISWKQFALNSR